MRRATNSRLRRSDDYRRICFDNSDRAGRVEVRIQANCEPIVD
ncbi:MAG: hypothetical protein FD165_613 [Gammaproteobacteria bacterium]|nr:MAG: hypothetical protein FD165_613 [Gammaproteobacteria bacterium]TND02125.1 MAG: hypothetical protein FD120_2289 [Gammaproteobacteria bacterium]